MKRFMHFLVLAAIFSVGISPACEFLSGGKTLYELCNPTGDNQQAVLDQELAAYFINDETPQEPEHEESKSPCDFCFVQAHMKLAQIDVQADLFNHLLKTASAYTAEAQLVSHLKHKSSAPRGPPTLFV